MAREPKRLAKSAGVAAQRKSAAIKLPTIGSQAKHALFTTSFVENVRAVMKSEWPVSNEPDVQVNTYAFDSIGQCILTSPIPKYVSELTVTSEGLCKQCQEQGAGTQEWVFVRL